MGRITMGTGLLALALALSACGPKAEPPMTATQLAALAPADGRIAALYETSCKGCHANPAAGAPLVHDKAAWSPRLNQGLPVLVSHVVTGYKGMPPGGQCAACSPQDYTALVKFLAGQEAAQ
jgi:cytochrome c5